jgi:hypothetical protein
MEEETMTTSRLGHPQRIALLAILMLAASLIGSDPRRQPRLLAAIENAHVEKMSVGRLLWPGAFSIQLGSSLTDALFEASGRRYVAETRSDGFLVRRGIRAEDAIDVRFVDAGRDIVAELGDRLAGRMSVFNGAARTGVPTHWDRFSAATFREIYRGIAARYRSNDGDLELDFLVEPGADPRLIQLAGADGTRFAVDSETSDILVIRGNERFRLHRPRAFQPDVRGMHEVAVRAVANDHSLRFELPDYDTTRLVVIDPLIATWSTYLGTNTDAMYDNSAALATDSDGNLYVGGLTQLSIKAQPTDSFPTTATSLDPPNPRSPGDNCAYQCGYVLKLTPTHQVVYGALMYGLTVKAIAVGNARNAYITGSTLDGTTFPATPGAFDSDPSGQVFVSEISADGSSFVYSAQFPGDSGNGIAVDAMGNAYVVGQVSAPNLPTTPGSIKPSNPIGATINQDGFLLKINPSGSALVYGTYLGGSGADVANAVQVDADGQATVVGQTASSDFVGMTAAVSGNSDAFLLKVSSDGSRIVTGQTFGGSSDDFANGVAADGGGGWIMCGATTSTDLPTSSGALQPYLLGQRNGWVRRVDSGFNTIYSTYFGGSAIDGCLNVASDGNGNAYLVGVTFSADLPVTAGAFQDTTSAITDDYSFVGLTRFYVISNMPDRESYFAELSSTGALLYGSYLGGFNTYPRNYPPLTIGTGITVAPSGVVSVSGATEAADFPVTDGGLRNGMGGEGDGFIVSFADSAFSIATPSLLPQAPTGMPYSVTLVAAGGTPPYTWTKVGFELPDGIALSSTGVLSGAASAQQTESTGYQFTVKAADAANHVAYKSFFIDLVGPGSTFVCDGSGCIGTLGLNQGISYQLPPLARGLSPQTFSETGQLPPGISVSSTGRITGAPTKTGDYQFGFIIKDAAGNTAPLNVHLQVVTLGTSPTATLTATPASVSVGQSFSLAWSSSSTSGCIASGGGASGTAWSGNLPAFGSTTQTATVTGTFEYTVTCPAGTFAPVVARASVAVTGTTGSSGGTSGGGPNGSGQGSSGGGATTAVEIGCLAMLAAFSRRRREDTGRPRSRPH